MSKAAERVSFRFEYLGYVASVWTAAGAIAGGILMSGLLLAGRMHPEPALVLTVVLSTIGALLGVVHGFVLAYLGRPNGEPRTAPLATHLINLAYLVAAYLTGVCLALWVTLGALLARSGSAVGWLALSAGAICAAAVLAWASLLGWRAFMTAYHRWPEHRLGTLLVLGAFVVFASVLLALRPVIPRTELQLSPGLSLWLAGLAALWLGTPAAFVALRFAYPAPRSRTLNPSRVALHARASDGMIGGDPERR